MATIKKFIANSNGNRVFVSDLAAMADTIFGMMGAWPCPIPYCILKGVIALKTPPCESTRAAAC